MLKRLKLLMVPVLLLIWILIQFPDDKLHVIFCDVGQGDASLVVRGNFEMLIDTGPEGSKVLDCLAKHMPFWDKKLEILLNSHPDNDHIGGLKGIEKHYQVMQLIGADKPIVGDVIRYGDLQFDVVWTDRKEIEDTNQASVVGILKWKGFKALFTGDIPTEEELAMIRDKVLEKVDVLKVAHHGSKYSSSELFLRRIEPKVAVISVGKKNSYGHPSPETLSRLDAIRSRILRTDQDGEVEIVVESDGTYTVAR